MPGALLRGKLVQVYRQQWKRHLHVGQHMQVHLGITPHTRDDGGPMLAILCDVMNDSANSRFHGFFIQGIVLSGRILFSRCITVVSFESISDNSCRDWSYRTSDMAMRTEPLAA